MDRIIGALAVWALLVIPPGNGGIVAGEIGTRIDEYLTRLVPYGFSGAVLVARGGEVLLEKGYGLADRATKQPYTSDMVSSVGSVTKQFTAAAILALQMDGKLRTSDPISKYLPGVTGDKAGISIHHLLTHTAGFAGDLGGADSEPIGRDALVARVLSAPLAARPGERFEYSNEGYSLAGAIVERVSGTGYEKYLRERLFLPAGMRDTGYQLPAWPLERLPIGYTESGKPWGRVYRNGWLPDGPGWYLRANGGIHSTVRDLYRWHLALEGEKVLSAEALNAFQTGHVAVGDGERYAYGWGVRTSRRGTRVVSHNGGNGFLFTDFQRYPDEKVVIIAMSNQPVIPATQLAPRELESLVFGDAPVTFPPLSVAVPHEQREKLAGRYALAGEGSLIIRIASDGLEAEADSPALFGAFAGTLPPGGRFAGLEARSLEILEAAAKDDFQPLHKAFDDDRPLEVVQANQRRFWSSWRAEFGDFRRFQLMGTGTISGDPSVTVRLVFARGAPMLQMIWGPRRLVGFRIMAGPEGVRLVAETPDTWVHFRYRGPALVRLKFTGETLKIETGTGTFEARKE